MTDTELSTAVLDSIPVTIRFIRSEVKALRDLDIDFPLYRLIIFLGRKSATNGELADWQGVSVAAMSRMVDGLVKRGLVSRSEDPSDRRQVTLELSEAGRELLKTVRETLEARMQKKISMMACEQRSALREGLSVLRELFHETKT